MEPEPRKSSTRRLTIVAQDPSVTINNRILTTQVEVPAEFLARGPCGSRVHVIDYDSSTGTLYEPFAYPVNPEGALEDPFSRPNKRTVMTNPGFHAQNVYAIVMRTLGRFEYALGRRVSWGIPGHQLKVAPHAFADANAFYSREDECLAFGYFPGEKDMVFTCLSHDVIAHETCHALIDGLRHHFMTPSSPDQAAFHEGFSDIVALLSVFALRDVVHALLDRPTGAEAGLAQSPEGLIKRSSVTMEALKHSVLLGLAEQMGQELSAVRGRALRQSALLSPAGSYMKDPAYMEPHRRGEILVAAMLNAFIRVLSERLRGLGSVSENYLNRGRVAEEAADCAAYLLTMSIRALDYVPPVHLDFRDFLSALLTADHEIRPDDSRYQYRDSLRQSFDRFGITPGAASYAGVPTPDGLWNRFDDTGFNYDCVHFEDLGRDRDEMFRFVWEHRERLALAPDAYTEIVSLRRCHRIAPDDGFPLRETVAECRQRVQLTAAELQPLYGIEKPPDMPASLQLTLHGGTTLIFDEFGRVKFSISNSILNRERQADHLRYLWKYGYFDKGASLRQRFSRIHLRRSMDLAKDIEEEW
ncbi:MAG: hypothetical protein H6985_00810 [Pseudomonadales bacterium]|nr:hypothetical protein [Pseudomonadales bacterium]